MARVLPSLGIQRDGQRERDRGKINLVVTAVAALWVGCVGFSLVTLGAKAEKQQFPAARCASAAPLRGTELWCEQEPAAADPLLSAATTIFMNYLLLGSFRANK